MKVVEKFISINGEGRRAGELAVFIRFKGCNLNCSWCDTSWADEEDCRYEELSIDEIFNFVKETGIKNITLTGGEPLLQEDINELIKLLTLQKNARVEIETNGSIDLSGFYRNEQVSFTIDYKLPSSGFEKNMYIQNYKNVNEKDTVKFIVADYIDLERMKEVVNGFSLTKKCVVYVSPVFGKIKPAEIVEYMKVNKMNDIRVQLQLHKFIWNPDERGV